MDEAVFSYVDATDPIFIRIPVRALEALTGARELERLYLQNKLEIGPGKSWFACSLQQLKVELSYDERALDAVPRTGPLVIVANHPFGVLDGIALTHIVSLIRPDFKVLTNAVLMRAPEIRECLLPVDFDPTPDALATNLASRAKARAHLEVGGALIVFPAGAVSTSPDRWGRAPARDGRWQPFVGQLVQRTRADVLPVFFPGQNSRLFQIASHLHPMLRLGLFFHELRRRIGTRLPITIGETLSHAELSGSGGRQELAERLRAATYALADQPRPR